MIDLVIRHPLSALSGVKARGLIDTGADFVLCAPSIARSLGLRQTNTDVVGGIGGEEVDASVYSGKLIVEELSFQRVLPIYAVPWGPTSHTVLLGRSFLQYFVFEYDGPSEVFHFSAPLHGSSHIVEGDG